MQVAAAAARPPLAPQACRRMKGGVKNIEGRIRNKTFKIKKLTVVPKNIQVKKNGQVVPRITVCRIAIFPAKYRRVYY